VFRRLSEFGRHNKKRCPQLYVTLCQVGHLYQLRCFSSLCVFREILQQRQWTMDPVVHNVQQETVYFTRSLLDLAHRIIYATTLPIEKYCYVYHSRHSYKYTYFSVYIRFLTSPKPSPPPPHLRDLALIPLPRTLYTP
jgi:hypothetical protein